MVGRGLALSLDVFLVEQDQVLSSSMSCTGVLHAHAARCSLRVVYECRHPEGSSGAPAAHRMPFVSLLVNRCTPGLGLALDGESGECW